MRVTVAMQDPTFLGTTYHYEAILAAVPTAAIWRGFYAFATRDGVDHLMEEDVVHELIARGGKIELVVGLDAITNRKTLERLRELEHQHPNFSPRVFWNETQALFHPKLSDFTLTDGRRTLIIGSGNLTPGGLRTNYEAYTVINTDQDDELDLASLLDFSRRHASQITPIDDRALERAELNRPHSLRRSVRSNVSRPPDIPSSPPTEFDRILVAQVPKAGGRWAQVHFNSEVIQSFFNVRHHESDRLYLSQVLPQGQRDSIEVRRCVYSEVNKNYKIEIGAAKGYQYPSNDRRPLLLFFERQLRTFDYLLLMPGDTGYEQVSDLSNDLPPLGRGLRRSITDTRTLSQTWAECPLFRQDYNDYQSL